MEDKLINLLESKADAKSILIVILLLIVGIFLLLKFIKLVKICVYVEQESGISAFTLPKIVLIAIVPTIYNVFAMLDAEVDKYFKMIAIITAVVCLVVLLWNMKSFGIIYGVMFSVMHICFGLLASVAISALAIVAVVGVVLMLFGGMSGGSVTSTSSTSTPEYVRNPDTGELIYVEKGVNGELYIEGTSTVLRQSDYSGRYIDSNGNEYIG